MTSLRRAPPAGRFGPYAADVLYARAFAIEKGVKKHAFEGHVDRLIAEGREDELYAYLNLFTAVTLRQGTKERVKQWQKKQEELREYYYPSNK